MHLIDTHCHLDFSLFDPQRPAIITAAQSVGVQRIVVPGVDAERWSTLLQLCQQHAALVAALGLHPCFLAAHQPEHLQQLDEHLQRETLCAVGEIGLDFFIPEPDIERQLYFFTAQLDLAKKHQLPVILHVRKAHDQVLKLLRQKGLVRGGVVHAFSGSEQQAEQYTALGFKLGIGGTVTYERAKKLRRIVANHPLSDLVLETDAPDMPLAGYQGKPNQPSRVFEVAKTVAEIRGCALEEVAEITSSTAAQLFRI